MTSTPSPQGRRIIVAVVTGDVGARIQSWRLIHDPTEAVRLPPHATLCYWAPDAETEDIEKQVHHAFSEPVSIRLGPVQQGDNDQGTLFVAVLDQDALTAGLKRLYDGSHVQFPEQRDWRWHITCIRDTREKDVDALKHAAESLTIETPWRFDTIAYLELRGDKYEALAEWKLA